MLCAENMGKLIVNERFISIQGEGYWVGTPMSFIRLAGCPVGGGNRICKDYAGREFPCDTYYQGGDTMMVDELLAWCLAMGLNRVCITGGEPFAQDIDELLSKLWYCGFQIHIETSGTLQPCDFIAKGTLSKNIPWITVSPKGGFNQKVLIQYAHEVKWLVHVDSEFVEPLKWMVPIHKFLQPVWDDKYKQNVKLAIELVAKYSQFRLSLQVHKMIGVL